MTLFRRKGLAPIVAETFQAYADPIELMEPPISYTVLAKDLIIEGTKQRVIYETCAVDFPNRERAQEWIAERVLQEYVIAEVRLP